MLTIETLATVTEEGTMTARVPSSLGCGAHRVVIVVDEKTLTARGGTRRLPDMAAFRAKLGAPVHPGNTVVEMREEERS